MRAKSRRFFVVIATRKLLKKVQGFRIYFLSALKRGMLNTVLAFLQNVCLDIFAKVSCIFSYIMK